MQQALEFLDRKGFRRELGDVDPAQVRGGESMSDLELQIPVQYKATANQLLLESWPVIAATCYEQASKGAKGLLLIDLANHRFDYCSWRFLVEAGNLAFFSANILNKFRNDVFKYNPETECLFLFEFPEPEFDSIYIRVNTARLTTFAQYAGNPIPEVRSYSLLTPKEAFEQTKLVKLS